MLNTAHFLTHVGLGWIVANLGALSRRDRCLVVLAGILPDLDGVGILWGEQAYLTAHRAVGHSLLFGLVLLAITVFCATAPLATGALAALSFHLHLLLDVVGTGGRPVRYLWPFTDWSWTWSGHWTLASWPNGVVIALTVLGVLVVAWRRGRTPVECLSQRADRFLMRHARPAQSRAITH